MCLPISQEAYEEAYDKLFATLDDLDARLGRQHYLCGDRITEADWRLFSTLLRFDLVYYGNFKCNKKHIYEYANLWNFTLELYQHPGVAEATNLHHIKRGYYHLMPHINPSGITPKGPEIDFMQPHDRRQRYRNRTRVAAKYGGANGAVVIAEIFRIDLRKERFIELAFGEQFRGSRAQIGPGRRQFPIVGNGNFPDGVDVRIAIEHRPRGRTDRPGQVAFRIVGLDLARDRRGVQAVAARSQLAEENALAAGCRFAHAGDACPGVDIIIAASWSRVTVGAQPSFVMVAGSDTRRR